jgi:hypothetical protein
MNSEEFDIEHEKMVRGGIAVFFFIAGILTSSLITAAVTSAAKEEIIQNYIAGEIECAKVGVEFVCANTNKGL